MSSESQYTILIQINTHAYKQIPPVSSLSLRKNNAPRGDNSFRKELALPEKGDKNGRVASSESILNGLNG